MKNDEGIKEKILKTGAVAAGVYGGAHFLGKLRQSRREFPEFDSDVPDAQVAMYRLDYALITSLHRIYTLVKREEFFTKESWKVFSKAARCCSDFLRVAVIDEVVRDANSLSRKTEKKLDLLLPIFKKDPFVARLAEEDVDTIKTCLSSHVQNLFVDAFF